MSDRKGDWIQTFTGKQFWPLDPRPGDFVIEDIAHALSNTCRYNGHCRRFYSVAEHSVHVARAAAPEHKLAALLHDAAEAYIADVPRPIKPLLKGYKSIEGDIEAALAERFGFTWPFHDDVHELDHRILSDEYEHLMAKATPWSKWLDDFPPLGITLPCWQPNQAKFWFLTMFDEVTS